MAGEADGWESYTFPVVLVTVLSPIIMVLSLNRTNVSNEAQSGGRTLFIQIPRDFVGIRLVEIASDVIAASY